MLMAIPFPDISPDIFRLSIAGFEIAPKWYAAAYIIGILGGWFMARWLMKHPSVWPGNKAPMTVTQVEDVMTWATLGIVLGGRLGYVVFYQPAYYLQNPIEALYLWQGGMSFHGGMIGTGLALIVYALKNGVSVIKLLDTGALCTPLGLGLGRVANFINAELWGRPSDAPWAVIFPGGAAQTCANVGEFCARHPSQLYEAILEGLVLLIVMWVVALRGGLKAPGLVWGIFLTGYGAARVFVEHFRQADAQYITPDNPLGHVIGSANIGLSMGQVLSLPMVAVGLIAIWLSLRAARA